uniref:Basic region leucine zipper n=1 Tax=Musca domestica TaxID=7370 RepID=T1PDY9_MUSDO
MTTKTNLVKRPCMISNTPEKTATTATTTVLKIPEQSSKPRIFLLTRPANLPLVRKIIPQTVEAHQKELNPESPHLLETTKVKQKREITKIIKIKQANQRHPLKLESIRKIPVNQVATHQYQVQQFMRRSYESKSPDSLQTQSKSLNPTLLPRQSVKSNITTTTATIQTTNNTVPAATSYSNKSNLKQVVIGKKPSSTLASMAGIELTGADMLSPTAADMSGAMPPTATVEEINVPVFIDEYLQEAAISTLSATSGTSVTTQNININNNNNNHHNNNGNNCNNSKEAVSIDEINQQTGFGVETFDENFEFDIELLTETTSKDQDKEKLLEQAYQQPTQQQQQQQQTPLNLLLTTSGGVNHINNFEKNQEGVDVEEQQKQQLQSILDEILFGNSPSCSNNNNITITNNNNNSNTIPMAVNNLADICNNHNNMYDENGIFDLAPNSQNLNNDDLDLDILNPSFENAVDIHDIKNEDFPYIMDCNGAENSESICNLDDPMFCGSLVMSSQSSQLTRTHSSVAELSQEIMNAEPHISPNLIHYSNEYLLLDTPATSTSMAAAAEANDGSNSQQIVCMDSFVDDSTSFYNDDLAIMTEENPLKRSQSPQTLKHMQEKRAKLRLDTKRRAVEEGVLDTPGVVRLIDEQLSLPLKPAPEETTEDIFNSLIACSPHESSDSILTFKSEAIDMDYNSNDITPPYTPYSVNSSNSNQTNFSGIINQQPYSPAPSVATTCATTKRGRGRPAKIHSDVPDPSQLAHLPESEQKKVLERAKNNEASRKSRLKNKEREEAIEREERDLIQHNIYLNTEWQKLLRLEKKLRRACKRASRSAPY